MTTQKRKSKLQRLNQFIKDFSIFIRQCYCNKKQTIQK